MGIKDLLTRLRGSVQCEKTEDACTQKEVIICLAKIKKELQDVSEASLQHNFLVSKINPDLKALQIISHKLNQNGFKTSVEKAEYDVSPATLTGGWEAFVMVKLANKNNKGFKDQLNKTIDNYFQELGISLDVVEHEIKSILPTCKNYENITNNIKEEKVVKTEEQDINKARKLKI